MKEEAMLTTNHYYLDHLGILPVVATAAAGGTEGHEETLTNINMHHLNMHSY